MGINPNQNTIKSLPSLIPTCRGCSHLINDGCDPFNGTNEWKCDFWNHEIKTIIMFGGQISVPIPYDFDLFGKNCNDKQAIVDEEIKY